MKKKISVKYFNYNDKIKRYKNKTIDTLVLKGHLYNGSFEYWHNININNLIVNINPFFTKPKTYISLNNVKSKNIYFGEKTNNEGLNVSYEYLVRNKLSSIELSWIPDCAKIANINKLNISYGEKPFEIKLKRNELEKINISVGENYLVEVLIKNVNSEKSYIIGSSNMLESIDSIFITKDELNNGELDLTKYDDLGVISLGDLNIKTLIIKKEDISNLNKIKLFDGLYIENIKVVDDNMKLIPEKVIFFNGSLEVLDKYITNGKENILLYVDSENNLRVYDKKNISDNKYDEIEFIRKEKEYIIVCQKNNKYKIIIDDREYYINSLLKFFMKENIKKYTSIVNKSIYYIKQNDFVSLMKECLSSNNFILLYSDYIIFKDNLKKLFKVGFKYEYFMYLHERGLDSVIINMCEDTFDVSKFNKEEIDELNTLGKTYVKK